MILTDSVNIAPYPTLLLTSRLQWNTPIRKLSIEARAPSQGHASQIQICIYRSLKSGTAGSCLPLVSSLQNPDELYNWFPLPFQLPVVIRHVECNNYNACKCLVTETVWSFCPKRGDQNSICKEDCMTCSLCEWLKP